MTEYPLFAFTTCFTFFFVVKCLLFFPSEKWKGHLAISAKRNPIAAFKTQKLKVCFLKCMLPELFCTKMCGYEATRQNAH